MLDDGLKVEMVVEGTQIYWTPTSVGVVVKVS